MGMHSKPSRAALLAKTGACSGAALVLSASGILLAPPAGADGIPPGEAETASAPKKPAKKSVKQANRDQPAKVNSTVVEDDETNGDSDRAVNGLLNIADLNIQVIGQICNNFVPVNVLGGQGAGESLSGGLSLLGDVAGTDTQNLKGCEQTIEQTVGEEDGDDDGDGDRTVNGLVNVTDNNLHVPLQGCNNFVPVNVLGGQGAGEQVTFSGALGILDGEPAAESTAENSKSCDQGATQDDDDTDGDNNTNGLVNVTDNNVHVPVQACNNYVPVNVLGGQGSGEAVTGAGAFDLGALFGDDEDDTTATAGATNAKSCDQDSGQNDDD